MSDSGTEEETYSLMFSSLRHPARRKILRMLSDKTMTFSQMLEELAIPSSHLTYHLENLGDLVLKEKDGKYKLSSFGKASVSMMKNAEEVPNSNSKRFSAIPLRWKTVFAVFAMSIVLLAGVAYVEYAAVNTVNSSLADLQDKFTQLQNQNERLLQWTPSGNMATIILKDVIQIDVNKYQTTLESSTASINTQLGGVVEEVFQYSLVNAQSNLVITLRFRDGHFSLYTLSQLTGAPNYPPVYTQPQATDPLQATQDIIDRYASVMNDTYLPQAKELMAIATDTGSDQILGNVKLQLTIMGATSQAEIMYTDNGTDFKPKEMIVKFDDHLVNYFSDDWFLYNIGDSHITISANQAELIAKNAVKTFSWDANGTHVSNFNVLDNPVTAVFYPHPKTDTLILYPYWLVTLNLDKTYPGNVNQINVGVWGDTGKVEAITLGGPVASS